MVSFCDLARASKLKWFLSRLSIEINVSCIIWTLCCRSVQIIDYAFLLLRFSFLNIWHHRAYLRFTSFTVPSSLGSCFVFPSLASAGVTLGIWPCSRGPDVFLVTLNITCIQLMPSSDCLSSSSYRLVYPVVATLICLYWIGILDEMNQNP